MLTSSQHCEDGLAHTALFPARPGSSNAVSSPYSQNVADYSVLRVITQKADQECKIRLGTDPGMVPSSSRTASQQPWEAQGTSLCILGAAKRAWDHVHTSSVAASQQPQVARGKSSRSDNLMCIADQHDAAEQSADKLCNISQPRPHLQRGGVATAAGGAVEEVGAAADAADAACVAVKLLLVQVVVEKAAAQARICAERRAAALARRPRVLPQPAQRALQLAHRRAVQLVPLGRVLRACMHSLAADVICPRVALISDAMHAGLSIPTQPARCALSARAPPHGPSRAACPAPGKSNALTSRSDALSRSHSAKPQPPHAHPMNRRNPHSSYTSSCRNGPGPERVPGVCEYFAVALKSCSDDEA